jgi:predicted RNase H-like nuclease (RuvC/YqgF family)
VSTAGFDEVPQKKKRKRSKPTLDRKFDALQKSVTKNEDRIKELQRQLKRSKTLLKQKKQKLARMKRAFEGELASTAELSDNQLAVRLRLARDAS